MSPGQGPTPGAHAPPRLRAARLDDYPEIRRIEEAHGLLAPSSSDWSNLWLDNPLRARLGDGWPIGWVLEDAAGRLVGSLGNIPSLYVHRGRALVAANGRAWVVAPEHRSVALWLMDEYFNQEGVDLFVNTTVNSRASDAFGVFGSSRVPLGDWQAAAYWVTGYRGFAAAALRLKNVPLAGPLAYPAATALRLRDALAAPCLPAPPAFADVARIDAFDARFDAFWQELVRLHPDRLLAVRDRRTLSWHFAGPLRSGRAWIVTASRRGLLRAYGVLKRQDHPPSGLARLRLVDYQTVEPGEDWLPGLLHEALRAAATEGAHVLEHLGCGLPKMRAFDRGAPYRRRLAAWPFFYKATAPTLAAELGRPEAWDPSAYDGDASLC